MTKNNVASHFDHLELTIAVVLLMMPSVSCDASVGISQPESYGRPYFNHLK